MQPASRTVDLYYNISQPPSIRANAELPPAGLVAFQPHSGPFPQLHHVPRISTEVRGYERSAPLKIEDAMRELNPSQRTHAATINPTVMALICPGMRYRYTRDLRRGSLPKTSSTFTRVYSKVQYHTLQGMRCNVSARVHISIE
jgi:hypothetical protein